MAAAENIRMDQEEIGRLARETSEFISTIIDEVVSRTMEAARAHSSLPEIITAPTEANDSRNDKEITQKHYLKLAVDSGIPAALTAVGVGLHMYPALIVLMAAGGGGLSAILRDMRKDNVQKIPVITQEDIQTCVDWDEALLKESRVEANRKIAQLGRSIDGYEKKYSQMTDVGTDQGFGAWIQQFWIYCDKHPEDQYLGMLRNTLRSRLACMGISVYDTPELNDAGKPDVPYQDYLMDSRQAEDYTEVPVPAVYSKKALLAKGEIK